MYHLYHYLQQFGMYLVLYNVQKILQEVVAAQCDIDGWTYFLSMPITNNPEFEKIRITLIGYNEKYGLDRQNRRGFLLADEGIKKVSVILDKFDQGGRKFF